MRILIFGGTGFVGGRLLPRLRENGHKVFAPSRRELDLTLPVADLTKYEGTEAIIHMAAMYGGMPFDINNETIVYHTNSKINLHAFDCAQRIAPKTFVTIGSACAYPGYSNKDFDETDLFTGPLHHTVLCHGLTKLAMVASHQMYWRSHKLAGVHLIPANLYGPGDVFTIERSHVVAALLRKYSDAVQKGGDVYLMGDGSSVREFLYVDDLVEMIVAAVERPPNGLLIANAGPGQGHTIKHLANVISTQIGFQGHTHWNSNEPNGAPRKVMRKELREKELGLFNCLKLEEGIQRTLNWYMDNKRTADLRQ